jgi:hypothetical protein
MPSHSADISRLTEERASELHDGLQRAFAVLDELQLTAAKKLLDDKGIDLDTGGSTTTHPGEAKSEGESEGGDDDGGEPMEGSGGRK